MDVRGQVIGLLGRLLDELAGPLCDALQVLDRQMLLGFRQYRCRRVEQALDLVERRDAGRCREGETAGLLG